jgi:hypothetical protein
MCNIRAHMNPESQHWYYARDGEQHGPVKWLKIKNLIASGELVVDDLVWNETLDDWLPFREVSGETAANQLSSTAVPTGSASAVESRLPIPYDLKRASFPKLMILGGITIALVAGLVGLIIFNFSRSIPTVGPGGTSVSSPGSPFDSLISPATILLGIVAVGVLVWFIVVSMIYVHRAWRMLQSFGASITPGIAVGFQFIPIFNLYWAFRAYYNWSREYNSICARHPSFQIAPRAAEGVFLAYCVIQVASTVFDWITPDDSELEAISGMLGLVSIILFVMMFYQICNAINYFIEVRDRQAMTPRASF